MIANTPSLPFDLLELLKASESLLKQNAAASPTAISTSATMRRPTSTQESYLRNIKLSIYHNAQVT